MIGRKQDTLAHYGVPGMKWGVRKSDNRPSGDKVFISGTSKMDTKDSIYYRKKLPKTVTDYLDKVMNKKARVLIGDCVGADTMVQKYLAKNKYKNVHIYVSGDEVRNNADKKGSLGWKVHNVDASMYEKGSKEWHAVKDKAMNKEATSGMAIILDEGAKATRKNIDRFIDENKNISIYELNKQGKNRDRWLSSYEYVQQKINQ